MKNNFFEILAHRATILRSSPTNKTGKNTIINSQSSSAVALKIIFESLISFKEVSYVAAALLVTPGTCSSLIVVKTIFFCICLALRCTEDLHLKEQDKVNYAVSEREDRVTGASTLTRLYWAVLSCIGLCWAVLGCTGLYRAVLGCTGL